ncbi:hypothetical protein JX266_011658 [Neoarthrinium moseri]|nr:hypothetical protein JX266_011658 [Neoarthrinium moseri]
MAPTYERFIEGMTTRREVYRRVCYPTNEHEGTRTVLPIDFWKYKTRGHSWSGEEAVQLMISHANLSGPMGAMRLAAFRDAFNEDNAYFESQGNLNDLNGRVLQTYVAAFDGLFFQGLFTNPRFSRSIPELGQPWAQGRNLFDLCCHHSADPRPDSLITAFWHTARGKIGMYTRVNLPNDAGNLELPFGTVIKTLLHELTHAFMAIFVWSNRSSHYRYDVLGKSLDGHGMAFWAFLKFTMGKLMKILPDVPFFELEYKKAVGEMASLKLMRSIGALAEKGMPPVPRDTSPAPHTGGIFDHPVHRLPHRRYTRFQRNRLSTKLFRKNTYIRNGEMGKAGKKPRRHSETSARPQLAPPPAVPKEEVQREKTLQELDLEAIDAVEDAPPEERAALALAISSRRMREIEDTMTEAQKALYDRNNQVYQERVVYLEYKLKNIHKDYKRSQSYIDEQKAAAGQQKEAVPPHMVPLPDDDDIGEGGKEQEGDGAGPPPAAACQQGDTAAEWVTWWVLIPLYIFAVAVVLAEGVKYAAWMRPNDVSRAMYIEDWHYFVVPVPQLVWFGEWVGLIWAFWFT